jgi:hypothetical protein
MMTAAATTVVTAAAMMARAAVTVAASASSSAAGPSAAAAGLGGVGETGERFVGAFAEGCNRGNADRDNKGEQNGILDRRRSVVSFQEVQKLSGQ